MHTSAPTQGPSPSQPTPRHTSGEHAYSFTLLSMVLPPQPPGSANTPKFHYSNFDTILQHCCPSVVSMYVGKYNIFP